MSQNLPLEQAISQLSQDEQYLVRECAHEVQQVLDRYKEERLISLSLELIGAQLAETIVY